MSPHNEMFNIRVYHLDTAFIVQHVFLPLFGKSTLNLLRFSHRRTSFQKSRMAFASPVQLLMFWRLWLKESIIL